MTSLKKTNPRMIFASLTAYGEEGPERDREGFDLVAYWARTGLMDLVRTGDVEPAQSLPGMGDHPSAVALYAAIVTALFRRERTGLGSEVHTSLLANGLWAAGCVAQAKLVGADFSAWRSADTHCSHASRLSCCRTIAGCSSRWSVRPPKSTHCWTPLALENCSPIHASRHPRREWRTVWSWSNRSAIELRVDPARIGSCLFARPKFRPH